jgi:hypothetical protein
VSCIVAGGLMSRDRKALERPDAQDRDVCMNYAFSTHSRRKI